MAVAAVAADSSDKKMSLGDTSSKRERRRRERERVGQGDALLDDRSSV